MVRKSTHIETVDLKSAIVRARAQALKHEEEDRQRHWKMRWVKIGGVLAGILLLTTVIGIGVYEFDSESVDRDNAQIVRAWEQLLRNPNGESGNAGQLAALRSLYLAGQDFSGLDLGCHGQDLKNEDHKKCIFLQEIDLASNGTANLSGADLRKAILSGADLSETNLSGADLFGTKLNAADLSGANLSMADLRMANLNGANLNGANLKEAELVMTELILTDLRMADLSKAKLIGADLNEANLTGANLTEANLDFANLSGADLSETNLSGANLILADLSGADLREANLKQAYLWGGNLSEANLRGVINLTQNQLDQACVSKDEKPPELPEGLEPPKIICPEEF